MQSAKPVNPTALGKPPAADSQATADSQQSLLVSIRSIADPALLEPTYLYLDHYCTTFLAPPVAERLKLAIHELYSNALRHGSTSGEVKLELHKCREGVRLTIQNRAQTEQLQRLSEQVERVRENAAAAFNGALTGLADERAEPPMLGILRVAHEGKFEVELGILGERVSVSVASTELQNP